MTLRTNHLHSPVLTSATKGFHLSPDFLFNPSTDKNCIPAKGYEFSVFYSLFLVICTKVTLVGKLRLARGWKQWNLRQSLINCILNEHPFHQSTSWAVSQSVNDILWTSWQKTREIIEQHCYGFFWGLICNMCISKNKEQTWSLLFSQIKLDATQIKKIKKNQFPMKFTFQLF